MAQRGGSVNTHVRWDAEKVYSPLIGLGEADMLLVFELAEALRYVEFLKPGGAAIVDRPHHRADHGHFGRRPLPDGGGAAGRL